MIDTLGKSLERSPARVVSEPAELEATRAPCKAKAKPDRHHIVLHIPAQNANAATARSV